MQCDTGIHVILRCRNFWTSVLAQTIYLHLTFTLQNITGPWTIHIHSWSKGSQLDSACGPLAKPSLSCGPHPLIKKIKVNLPRDRYQIIVYNSLTEVPRVAVPSDFDHLWGTVSTDVLEILPVQPNPHWFSHLLQLLCLSRFCRTRNLVVLLHISLWSIGYPKALFMAPRWRHHGPLRGPLLNNAVLASVEVQVRSLLRLRISTMLLLLMLTELLFTHFGTYKAARDNVWYVALITRTPVHKHNFIYDQKGCT